jgi:hypothetical protein
MEKLLVKLGLDEHEINIFQRILRNIKASDFYKEEVSRTEKYSS